MPTLHELQAAFARHMFDAQANDLFGALIPARRMHAQGGLDVYRNNVFQNYLGALRDTYPVVLRLIGDDFFTQTARDYVRATPSSSGDIHDYGAEFGDFLRNYPGASELVYLPDVAKLEWAVHRSYHATDADALDISQLAHVPDETLPALRFDLHPSCRLIASRWPVLTIWRANQADADGSAAINLDHGGEQILVMRPGTEVELTPLAPGNHAALLALHEDKNLADALDCALTIAPDFDINQFLMQHVLDGTLVAFHSTPEKTSPTQD